MKTCSKCGIRKRPADFHKKSSGRKGRNARCKACMCKHVKAWYLRDVKRARRLHRVVQKRYYRHHRKLALKRIAQWKKANRAIVAAQLRDYGARRRGGSGTVTAAQWARIVLFYGHRCGICHKKRPLTADHYVALKNGGGHSWENVWPLCIACNVRKSNRVYPGHPPHVVKLRKVI